MDKRAYPPQCPGRVCNMLQHPLTSLCHSINPESTEEGEQSPSQQTRPHKHHRSVPQWPELNCNTAPVFRSLCVALWVQHNVRLSKKQVVLSGGGAKNQITLPPDRYF
ncbi:hypothetical protein ATANTOWER_020149 [Ataeniobius toweri]|uniref:Uncharacterized protein n=1 Tax=Ataeniobius toweri TaxID=208326 RepID=A0ABU7B547_9TELE|nr:hypothetical protein [Ataeniobius toweri]